MRRSLSAPFAALLICTAAAIVGCGDDEQSGGSTGPAAYSIVGDWETDYPASNPNPISYFTFSSDGSYSVGRTYPPSESSGVWSVRGDTLTMDSQVPDHEPADAIMSFGDADNVVLTPVGAQQGDTLPLTRYVM
ncbi:MAG: hypothetical protein GF331_07525 [Chitinivibrionales bacterium]|nr:hypothetical protein [Chitinivibrionales bacterium]